MSRCGRGVSLDGLTLVGMLVGMVLVVLGLGYLDRRDKLRHRAFEEVAEAFQGLEQLDDSEGVAGVVGPFRVQATWVDKPEDEGGSWVLDVWGLPEDLDADNLEWSTLRRLAGVGVELGHRRLTSRFTPSRLGSRLQELLDLAQELTDLDGVETRLTRIATDDPSEKRRLQATRALLRSFPEGETAQTIAPDHLDSKDLFLRAGAAQTLGRKDVLRELAAGSLLSHKVRLQAAKALDWELDDPVLGELVDYYPQLIDRITDEAVLVTLLDVRRIDAAERLALIGTTASVMALKERAGTLTAAGRAARDAVAAIQSRVEGAEAGQLSLPREPRTAGALSTVDVAPSGALSEPEEPH